IGEDLSTDGTREIVQRYAAADNRVRPILHPTNLGMNPNFGETLAACHGKYVAILDSDDYWLDDQKLAHGVALLDQNPDCAMCFHRALLVDEAGTSIEHESVIRVVKPK